MSINEESVLNKIIAYHKLEELARLNVIEIINQMLGALNERENDIISRRYGLKDGEKQILEGIGRSHGLTRERVRQIEVSSLEKLRKARDLEHIRKLKKIIIQVLEEHGGLIEKDYLFDVLVHFSTKTEGRKERIATHQNAFDFLLAKILNEDFEVISGSKVFLPSYKLVYYEISHLEDLALGLEKLLEEREEVFATHDLIDRAVKLSAYEAHKEKVELENNIDLSGLWKSDLYKEDSSVINSNKVVYSILRAAKNINQNVFGHWGLAHWPEIKPKNINDKIYIILKNFSRNMHFSEIAEKINEIGIDRKKANVASIHNELILDEKYVLVGRGIYGLKNWGLERGTVSDVIVDIIGESEQPLSKEQVIEKVLERRTVKKTTIILALGNKDKFGKADGKYFLIKAEVPAEAV